MNREKKPTDKQTDSKKSADAVETPPPPQHMDPSKKPNPEKSDDDLKKTVPAKK